MGGNRIARALVIRRQLRNRYEEGAPIDALREEAPAESRSIEPCLGPQHDAEHPVHILGAGRLRWEVERQSGETGTIPARDPSFAFEDVGETVELGEAERRLQRRHSVVEADLLVVIALP